MKWISLMAFFLVGCGSDPVSRPFLAKPIPKKKTDPEVEPVAVVLSQPAAEEKAPRKVFSGKVTFQGVSAEELSTFRVIPETGKTLIIPTNATYEQVDGLWWHGAKANTWFKIPGSSQAWIGKAPEKFDGVSKQGDLEIYYKSSAIVKIAGFVKMTVDHPSWVNDKGLTRSPISSPWTIN